MSAQAADRERLNILNVTTRDIAGDMEILANSLDLMACTLLGLPEHPEPRDVSAMGDGATWAAMTVRRLATKLDDAARGRTP